MRPITEIAEILGLPADLIEPYGRYTAKIRLEALERFPKRRGQVDPGDRDHAYHER